MGYINSIQKKIPYGSNVLIECPRCGFRGEPCKHREGKLSTEILSWLLFLIPGIIYTSWRHVNTFCKCPDCGAKFLLEMDGDSNIVDNLIRIKKKQTARFWVIVLLFSILGIYSFTAAMKSGWDKAYNNAYNEVFGVTKSINNLTNPVKYNQQINNAVNNTNTVKVEQKVEQPKIEQSKIEEKKEQENKKESIISETKEEIKNEETIIEKTKDPKEEAREKMQNILKQIDKDYAYIDSYVGASCFGDCTSSVTTINIEFSENIGWYDFTVKSHAANWNNKIIRAIPGYFDKIWINYIYKGQTVCSCIFTEYQTNTFIPKGCTYYGYKE